MIRNFRNIGKDVLKKSGYYNTDQNSERKKIFLHHQSLVPSHSYNKNKAINRAITLNFYLDKKEFHFELDKELDDQERDYFFAFSVGATNDKKKLLSTNNIESLISKIFKDSLDYLKGKRCNKKYSRWLDNHIEPSYDDLLKHILNTFYREEIREGSKKEKKILVLDENYLIADQKDLFFSVQKDLENKQKDKTKKLYQEKIYLELLKKKFLRVENSELPSLFLVKFNGRHIMEMEAYRDSYLNLVYYDLLERFFIEDVISGKTCHVCHEMKEIIGNIPLSMKFYGTTNELFFENLKNKNAYKAFSICRECLIEVLTGMKHVENHFGKKIFNMDCYLIPDIDDTTDEYDKTLDVVAKILMNKNTRYKEQIDYLRAIMRKSERKSSQFSFNMMFFSSANNDFDILKFISNLELKSLLQKMQWFDDMSEKYLLSLGQFNNLNLWDIRFYLFPSDKSHGKLDYKKKGVDPSKKKDYYKSFGKELLNFLDNFLHENKIGYFGLIHRFVDIYRLRFYMNEVDILSPFKMILFITILDQIGILKEEKTMKKGHSTSEISKQEYQEFFQAHQRVYEGNYYRQGLFLLGTVISKILYAQKGKTATFMKKINLSGVPAHRVKNLVGEVKEYAAIYSVYEEPGIWGNIMDRLQGIEESGMKGDEIVFYLLTGISYDSYLGMRKGHEKKLNQEVKE